MQQTLSVKLKVEHNNFLITFLNILVIDFLENTLPILKQHMYTNLLYEF